MNPRRISRLACLATVLVLVAAGSPGCGLVARNKNTDKADPDRWESAIQTFEKEDRESSTQGGVVVFIGSSSIRRWELEKSFPGLEVINRGFGGSQIADSIRYAPRILLPLKPRVVVLYAGDNDISKGKSPKTVEDDFSTFVKNVHEKLPHTRVVFMGIKPSLKRWNLATEMKEANALIGKICKKDDRLRYVDVFTPMLGADGKPRSELFIEDGLHLNDRGYELWASLVLPHIKDLALTHQ